MWPSSPRGGCMIVDSTRKGKQFPDSMSKTISIWTCVLNRAILNYRSRVGKPNMPMERESDACDQHAESTGLVSPSWDCSLHLPLWVSNAEKAAIEDRLEGWIKQLEASGGDVACIASALKKPLRPLWVSQKSVIWLNEVPGYDSWDFTPIMLVSASSSCGILQQRTTSEFSWTYIAGAGDDEESWARGLSPNLFWSHAHELIDSGPDLCNQKVADIVEKDRVYRAQRGQNAPQLSVKPSKLSGSTDHFPAENSPLGLGISGAENDRKDSVDLHAISWLGSTNLAVGATQHAADASDVDSALVCERESSSLCLEYPEVYLHLPILNSKLDRFSLYRNLPAALIFAKSNLRKGNRLLVCCNDGEDISVCVCLAILTSFYTNEGSFDDGKSFSETCITKLEMRRRLVFICKFAVNARPSRGNLKQVFNFLKDQSVGSGC
ncbi:unnamed protein product [Ilex paraguariensis]|uniref:Initiator tRNA phosphoribosyl transferase family protein n=1 Tax=Ilex paraguariensis TaxID=185542 RepID=A0ABC8QWB3_9AQUA